MAGMQAVVFHGPQDVRVEEVPRPEIEEPDDVLLRVDRAAICGTDLPGGVIRHRLPAGRHQYDGSDRACAAFPR